MHGDTEMGRRAQEVVVENVGATERTLDALSSTIDMVYSKPTIQPTKKNRREAEKRPRRLPISQIRFLYFAAAYRPGNFVPIDNVEKSGDIVRSTVLILSSNRRVPTHPIQELGILPSIKGLS